MLSVGSILKAATRQKHRRQMGHWDSIAVRQATVLR